MFITRTALPRRTILRGLGAAIGLPLLDAMVPAATALAATPAVPPKRFGFMYIPHGADMASWTPRRRRTPRPVVAHALACSTASRTRWSWSPT